MNKAISFLGEYTIGLSIAPTIKELLHKEYKFITPIFPWMTREGSNISKHLHKNDQFKIFGVYPRRPKLHSDSTDIEIKINANIILGALEGIKQGIPIIAGCPLVTNFWELSDNPKFVWIKLNLETIDDLQIKLEKNEPFPSAFSNLFFSENQYILNYINEHAKMISIDEALNSFREINMKSMNSEFYPRFGFGGTYKPIYFLLKD